MSPRGRLVPLWGADRNARDLGGLPLRSGGETRRGVFVRMAQPNPLDANRWSAIVQSGVTRFVDLRNDDEVVPIPLKPESIETIRAPLEVPSHPEYSTTWNERQAEPEFYAWSMQEHPRLWARAFAALAVPTDGGIVIHCAGGRDRTGIITALLLDAAGVEPEAVLDDYEDGIRGAETMKRLSPGPEPAFPPERLDPIVQTWRDKLAYFLDTVDVSAVMRAADAPENLLQVAAAKLRPEA